MNLLRELVRWKNKTKQKKKKKNRSRKEIDAFFMLLWLGKKLIPRRIEHRKSKIVPPNCIYNYSQCVLEYIEHLAKRNVVGEIWEDAYKVSFTDFLSSVDLPHL